MIRRSLFASLTFLMLCFVSVAEIKADPVTVSGSTQGSFNGGAFGSPVNLGDSPITPLVTGLTFTGANFSTTANPSSSVTLGSFNLTFLTEYNYGGDTFTLRVTFTAPAGIAGANPTQFTADLSGNIRIIDLSDNVDIVFSNPTQTFSFSNGNAYGTFTLTVNDLLNLNEGQTRNLTGTISNASATPNPEPATMILLGTGLAGISATIRRRRRQGEFRS